MKSRIQFQAHPPERRRRGLAPWQNGVIAPCCCCCCCCLHSLGGLIGALTLKTNPDSDVDARPLYWRCLGLATLAAVALFSIGNGPEVSLLFILLGLPCIQLAASVVSFIAAAVIYKPPEQALAYSQIGRIVLRTILGTLAGIAVMFGLAVVLSR